MNSSFSHHRLSLLIPALFFAIVANACAFEADGFKSGMTMEEVAHKLTAQNLSISTIGDHALSVKHAEIKSDLDLGPFFEFCSKRLVSYAKQLPFDEELIRTMDSLVMAYGDPSKSETYVAFRGMNGTPNQKAYRIVWVTHGGTIYLEIIPEIKDSLNRLLFGRKLVLNYTDMQFCK